MAIKVCVQINHREINERKKITERKKGGEKKEMDHIVFENNHSVFFKRFLSVNNICSEIVCSEILS